MASKKKTDFGSYDFDSDLNFDFDFDEPKAQKKQKKDKPITHVMEGVKESMKMKFTDPYHLRSMIRKSLPGGFGAAYDTIETVVSTTDELIDEARKELAPHLGGIARKLDSMTPDSAGRFKRFTQMLKEKMSGEVPSDFGAQQQSAEESGLQRMFAEMELQRSGVDEARHRNDQARQLISDRVNGKRMDNQQKILGIIANESVATRSYLTGFNVSYQKKSLELQYRSYSVLSQMAMAFGKYANRSAKFQDALLLNTSLPDYAKTSNTQRWKQISKEQVFGGLNKSFYGGNRIAAAANRLKKAGKEKITDMKDITSMIDDALEQAMDASQNAKDMAEMTGQKHSGWKTAGSFGGDMLGEFITSILANQAKGLIKKSPGLMKKSMQTGRLMTNPGALFDMIRNSKRFKGLGADGGELGGMTKDGLSAIMSLLSEGRPDLTIKNTSIGTQGENKLHTQERVNRTIVDVIPGFLSRILRELTIARTGDAKTNLLTYDSKVGQFKTEKQMSMDLRRTLRTEAGKAGVDRHTYAQHVESTFNTFAGKNHGMNADQSMQTKRFLTSLSRSRDDFDPTGQRIKTTKEFKALSPEMQKTIGDVLDKRLSGDNLETATNQFRLARGLHNTRNAVSNLMPEIQSMIREGHGAALAREGVIRRNKDNDWEVDEAAYNKFFDDTIGTSDVNVKTGIKNFSIDGKKALNGIKNTKLFNWRYKGNKTPHMGPMAQDVRKNFGNTAAPNGKSIDFVNLNGYTVAAVKKLSEMVEAMGASDASKHLASIDLTLKRATGIGDNESLLGHAGALASGLGQKAMSGASKGLSFLNQTAQSAGKMGKDFWSNNKESIKGAKDSAIRVAVEAASRAAAFGSNLIFNTIPDAFKRIKAGAGKLFDEVKNILHQAQDLYVPGRDSPAIEGALLTAGFYRDQETGKVLKTMDDITKAKGNIVNGVGLTVLSIEDRARGVYTSSGEKLKSFTGQMAGLIAGGGIAAYSHAKGMLQGVSSKLGGVGEAAMNKLRGFKDKLAGKFSGIGGIGGDRRMLPVLVQIRDLIALDRNSKKTKEILSRDISKDIGDGKSSLKTVTDTAKGIIDTINNAMGGGSSDGLAGASMGSAAMGGSGGIGGIMRGIGGMFTAGKQAIGGLGGRVSEAWARRNPEKAARIARIQARGKEGLLANKFSSGFSQSRTGKLASSIGSNRLVRGLGRGIGGGASLLARGAGFLGGLFGGGDQNSSQQRVKLDETAVNEYSATAAQHRLAEMNGLGGGYRQGGVAGDRNGDGERDGGAADRMQDMHNQRMVNDERKRASEEASRKGAEAKAGRISPADNAIEKMIAVATKGLAGLAGIAGDVLSGAAGLFGKGGLIKGALGAAKGLGRGVLGLGRGAIGLGAKAIGALRGIGSPIMNLASKLPGAARVASAGMSVVRAAQVVGLATGGAGAFLGTAASVIGSVISSPVVVGAAAVGGVGYGGYKLYKYMTRNSIDDYQRVRVMQYGLSGTDETKMFNNKVTALESYLLDGKLAFSGGTASINARAAKPDEIRELFDIAEDDKEGADNFAYWYAQRFQPVFLHHVNALYKVDNKAKLEDVGSLPAAKLLEYLSGADIGSVWDKTISPFKGLDVLGSNPQPSRDLLKSLTNKAGKDVNEKDKSAIKSAPNPNAENKPNKVQTDSVNYASKSLPSQRAPISPANQQFTKSMRGAGVTSGASEDDPSKSNANSGGNTTMSFSGTSGLKSAAGALADGSQGMQYVKLGKDAKIEGLHPRFKQNFLAMAQEYGEATGKTILVNQGYRSYQDQERIWKAHPDKAARPGSSMHEYGLAMDINTGIMNDLDKLGLLRKYGFTRPIGGETWHMEAAGYQGDIQRAKKDPNFADQAIQASIGRGGGGFGATPAQKKGGRNPALAKALYEATGGDKVELKNATGGAAGSSSGLSAPKIDGVAVPSAGGGRGSINPALASATGGGGSGSVYSVAPDSPGPSGSTGSAGGLNPGYASIGRGIGATTNTSGMSDFSGSMGGQHGDIKSIIAKSAQEAGGDPNKLMLMAAVESGLNPDAKAKTSSATGLHQFIKGTWDESVKKFGGKYGLQAANPKDPRASTIMATEYMKANAAKLQAAKGSPLTMVDEYMGHFLGAGGASAFMKADPSAIAASLNPDAASANRAIFYNGAQARTVGEVRQLLEGRLRDKAKKFGITYPDGGSSGGATAVASSSPAASSSTGSTASSGYSNASTLSSAPALYSAKSDTSTTARGVGFDAPTMTKASMGSSPALGGSPMRDTATQVTGELFDRLRTSAEAQTGYLASIDNSVSAMIPLLERIADNTGGGGSGGSSSGSSSSGDKKKAPEGLTGSGSKRADASSFDNRRVITTA